MQDVDRFSERQDSGQSITREDLEWLLAQFEGRVESVRSHLRVVTQAVAALTARLERMSDRLEGKGVI